MGNRYSGLADGIEARRQAKLQTERTAFSNCKEDLSDISFEVKGSSGSVKAMLPLIGAMLLFVTYFIIKYSRGDTKEMASSFTFVFGAFAVMLVIVSVALFVTSKKPPVIVRGKTVSVGDLSLTSDQISHVECTSMNQIKIHSKGKKVCVFSWHEDNGELFMAWARKCKIVILDKREF